MFCNSLCISVVICHTHLLWEQGVPSSSPGTPTPQYNGEIRLYDLFSPLLVFYNTDIMRWKILEKRGKFWKNSYKKVKDEIA